MTFDLPFHQSPEQVESLLFAPSPGSFSVYVKDFHNQVFKELPATPAHSR
jgi:hypothetical protein